MTARVRVGELVLEHAPASGPDHPVPILFVHGPWAGAWLWSAGSR